MGFITRSDCMSVTGLKNAVRHLYHVVDVCSNLQKISMTVVFQRV